jgi:hypothetical protein
MKHAVVGLGSALAALVLSGCGPADEPADPGAASCRPGPTLAAISGSGSAGAACATTENIIATEAQNYAFSSTITLPPVMVKPDSELTFDWRGVTRDLLGHCMNAQNDVDMVELGLWELNQTDLEDKLNADQLKQTDLGVIVNIETMKAKTSASLFEFTSLGTPLSPDQILPYMSAAAHPPADNTYTVMIATGIVLGQGTRGLQAFQLDPASTNTHVNLPNDSTQLVWNANLSALTAPTVPVGQPCINVDWSGMTVNALGLPFQPTDITEVLVGKYDETPQDLEKNFLDLEVIYEDIWRAEVLSGTSFNMANTTNAAGAPFPGIDGSSTWVMALVCGACANPAPWYLTVLKPSG